MGPVHCSCANGSQGLRHKSPKAPSARQSSKAANNTQPQLKAVGEACLKATLKWASRNSRFLFHLIILKSPLFEVGKRGPSQLQENTVFSTFFFPSRELEEVVRALLAVLTAQREGRIFMKGYGKPPASSRNTLITTAEGLLQSE